MLAGNLLYRRWEDCMNLSTRFGSLAAAGLLLLAAGCSNTNTTSSNPISPDRTAADRPANLTMADRDFVVKAAQGGMAEIEFGKLAARRSSSAKVRDYGRKLVEEHTKANDELKSIATQENIALP